MSSMSNVLVAGASQSVEGRPRVATQRWRCVICGFVYDEALGLPQEGIPPGTAWADVPEGWTCPDCGVRKQDFAMAPLGEPG
jgi:rubredoxin